MGAVRFYSRIIASTELYRMSRLIVLALVVALAAVASASPQFGNQFGYQGYGYGGGFNPYGGFSQSSYPNIVPGFGFYQQQPYGGFGGCQNWCQSSGLSFFGGQSNFYCCSTPQQVQQQNLQSGFGGGFNQFNQGFNTGGLDTGFVFAG